MLKKSVALVCAFLLLTGCTRSGSQPRTRQIFAMDTVMDLTLYDGDDSVLDAAVQLIEGLDYSLSVTNPESELYQLNESGSVQLTEDPARLLQRGLALCEETGGCLDLSIYPVVKAWGFTTDHHRIPAQQELETLLTHVNYRLIDFSPEDRWVHLPDGMEIDLGSVAKGYAGDRVTELLKSHGVTSALLNLGGNVQAIGKKPDGSKWKVGIQDPQGESYLGVLSVSDRAVITSGGYERYFEGQDGTVYWHIIDPKTGSPAKNGLISATAIGTEGTRCDALSTALFIMGPEQAVDFWRIHRDFDFILVTEENEVLISPTLEDTFTLAPASNYTLTVIEDA